MSKDKLISSLEKIKDELETVIKSLKEEENSTIISEDDYKDMMSILSARPFTNIDDGYFGEQ